MSRMSASSMMFPRAKGTPSPQHSAAPMPARVVVKIPKGGELHVKHVDNGVIASVRDKNWNTTQEVFADCPESLSIEKS